MPHHHERVWIWDVPASPAAIWPYLSDTARLNEAAGTPRYAVEEIAQPDGSVIRRASASFKGIAVEWDDPPYEWVAEREFRQKRVFRRGPLEYLAPALKLEAIADGGSRITYRLSGAPRGLVGHLLFAAGMLDRIGKGLEEMVSHAGAYARGETAMPFAYTPPPASPEQQRRLATLTQQIAGAPFAHGLGERLASHIRTAQEVDLVRIRPRKLAREWQVPLRHTVELCLEATRAGMLNLSWNLLCPRCGGAKAGAASLDQLPRQAHCPSCNISYDGDFTKNVEISFSPIPSIRTITEGEFCMGGPHVSRHILVQQIVQPGEQRMVAATLQPGEYRLRALEPGGECLLQYDGGAFPTVVAETDTAPGFTIHSEPGQVIGGIAIHNRTGRDLTLVIETRDWRRDALTAHEVTTMQAFRDLLPDQVLRPGEDVGIDNVTLIFTDLEGSTALYERLGDGAAYRLVRRHFGFLATTIRDHDGALVKTIGDAVMAAFATPEQAVRAALEIRDRIGSFNAEYRAETASEGQTIDAAIVLKMGLHGGRCIAVNLNDRLDYFGSTVNLAARLQGRCRGGEVILSQPLATDPAVAPLLQGCGLRHEAAELKGFDQPVPFVRLVA
ncbi:adenylate/guanylate cyclase domain-containing protein [Ferrovibrio sp.]|uniref:adenylate/guanylate cyclase domain-containing protein n=1 Tax=Ferrovibrio sp. TaxID=1917215 RepID=UPI00262913BC|nr:adenylate/guanylate cyclase domain-containing protein [Ferrovibrio sp.]